MARRARTRKPKVQNVALIYKRGEETIRYVDMPADSLSKEVMRLMGVMGTVRALMAKVRRIKHPLVQYPRFQLLMACQSVPDPTTLTPEQCVQEIGRLNYILGDALVQLSRFKTPFMFFKEAAFKLRYGQTSRKREAGWNSFKRDRETEHIPDPEGGESYEEY